MSQGLFDYHKHLQDIVDKDIAYVRKKDVQYSASWKRRGGPGAFFTIARPLDRWESISAGAGYDIFKKILSEGLVGTDGDLIACVRDTRRYLLLLEAEMTQQFQTPQEPAPPSEERAIPRFDEAPPRAEAGVGKLTPWAVGLGWRVKHGYGPKDAPSEDFTRWWTSQTPHVWKLEMFVPGRIDGVGFAPKVPAELVLCYHWSALSSGWLLNMALCPPDARDWFRYFREELNNKEFEEDCPEPWMKALYHWRENESKWILTIPAWARG